MDIEISFCEGSGDPQRLSPNSNEGFSPGLLDARWEKENEMTLKPKFACSSSTFVLILLILLISGCNRSAVRIHGASLAFPQTPTGYKAKESYPYAVVVSTPIDQRAKHSGEKVAGTKWKGCSTDPFWNTSAPEIIEQRLVTELEASNLFSNVSTTSTDPHDVIMKTEIHAFCSHTVGFFIARVAGISSLRVILEQNGKILLDRKFEKVVTDADKEYTGSKAGFLEQAMKVTMADSLRELLKDMFKQFEAEAKAW
jgi:ABC-type uncharacterized transport system auxiliary subunit